MARARKDPRHRAREAALQILYQWDIGKRDIDASAATFFDLQWPNTDPPADDLREFATSLARDTTERLGEVDPLIADTAERWRPERMAILDRLILRLAVCEMLRVVSTPPAVVINAWNEWTEGSYLFPEEKYGTACLEAARAAFGKRKKIA